MKSAALYARVATDTGAQLEAQTRLLELYAERHGYSVSHLYQDIGSGMSEDRSGLKALMGDARQRRFDAVVMLDPSRFFRDWALYRTYCQELKDTCQVEIIFVGTVGGDL